MSLQFSEFYQGYNSSNLQNGDKLFFKPNIPPKKLANAIKAYAPHVKEEDVYILADDTVFGKADNGMLITNTEIITKEQFENAKKNPLREVQNFKFGGILGGTFILNGDKIISFTQLSRDDKNKLSKCLNFYLDEKQKIDQDAFIKQKELEAEKAELHKIQLQQQLGSISLGEIISSKDKLLIQSFIEANNLIPLTKIKTEIHTPELILYNGNLQQFKRILAKTGMPQATRENVISFISPLFHLPALVDALEKNEIFEILMTQDEVVVGLIFMMQIITRGYLSLILDYMPEDRALEIQEKYSAVFGVILSQCLLALATSEKLDSVLKKMESLMDLDPNSDEVLIEQNRIAKAVKQGKYNATFDILKYSITENLEKDISNILISEDDPENYSFINVRNVCSEYVCFHLSSPLVEKDLEQMKDIESEVHEILEYLEENIKLKLSSIYL